MSYNVDSWKTKELVDLQIPVAALFHDDRKDWHPTRKELADGTSAFYFMDQCVIVGNVDGDLLHVSSIKAVGEGSGCALHYIVEPALELSCGKLVAVRVWEGGDSIDRLTVINGNLTSEEIEL